MNLIALPIAMAETLLANSLAGILVYEGHSGNCVLANQAVAEILGGSIGALRLQNFRTLASWRRAGLDDLADAVLLDGMSKHHEVTLYTDFGKNVSLDCFISRFDFEGRPHLMFIVTDITERVQAQTKLSKERALLRCLIDSVSDLIFIKDRDGFYRGCNKAGEAFIGMPEGEQIGKTDVDFFGRKKAEQIRKTDSQVLEEGKPQRVEEWVTGRDGRRLLMDTLKAPYYDSGGRALGLVGIGRDITERKRAEQERLVHFKFIENMDRVNRAIQGADDLEALMRDLLDAALSIFDCDRASLSYPCDPEAPTWNIPMERHKPGYPGVRDLEREMPMDPQVAGTLRTLLNSEGPVKFGPGTGQRLQSEILERFKLKSFMSMALFPKVGNPWQFGIHQCSHARAWTAEEERLFQEIGRRLEDGLTSMLAYRDLNEQLHFLQQLLDSVPIPVYYKDPEGLYLGCNAAFETFTGFVRTDIVGKTVHDVVPKERADKHHEVDLALLSRPGVQTYEVGGRYKDGKHHHVIFNKATFFDANDRVAGTVGALMDITERKQAERERLANLKFFENMDRVNRAIQGADDLESMMRDLLDVVLATFDCDRTFLMYPCDPESPTWTSPMERNKPEYPGVRQLGIEIPMDPQVAETLRILLATDGPVAFGPGTPHTLPEDVSEKFGIKSFMSMAIYPKSGSSWQFGIHQCASARIWTAEEMRMFEAIGRRLTDGLTSLLSYRDLRQNEEFLDKVVEHIPDMIFVKDAQDLRFVRFNKAGERLVGYARDELLGKTDHDFFPKDIADFFIAKDRQVLDAKELVDIPEETIQNRRKEKRILHTKKIPILDETGAPQYLLGISEDITEQKQAEASIRQLSQAIEQSPVSIVITDVEGNIEFVNAKFTQITGYTYAEVLGRNPRILKSGETPAEEYHRLWQTIRSGGIWQGEIHNRRKNGELFWEQVTIAPVRNAEDTITHYVAVKEDITERKKLEAQFRQVQKLEAIGLLAGGIAHDFNNILSAITGYTEISQSIIDPGSKVSEYLAHVLEASGRAKELINQIMMFSRETEQELRPIRVALPVKEALKLIRASVPATIEIRTDILSQASALADTTQVHQIVMNLCTNAAHAMKENGGLLQVRLTDITIDYEDHRKNYPDAEPGEYIRLTVSDQGHGIDTLDLDRIFDPFFTTKEKGEGTGMGLSVVHGIVKSYGGLLYVHSRPGEGSTFELLIPALESAMPDKIAMQKSVPMGCESILFVDDEEMVVDIAKGMLESLGYHVTVRTSAIEALEAFRNNPDGFDLLVTDLIMPKSTGLDLAGKILQIRPGLPIVLCTGFGVSMNEEQFVRRGVRGIIFKPILRRDMAIAVRSALDDTVGQKIITDR